MKIDFDRIATEEAPQAARIAEYLRDRTVMDVGCGPGIYVDAICRSKGMAFGVDNDERMPERDNFFRIDVTKIASPVTVDTVLSLEVGEHIPTEDAAKYVRFIRSTGANTVYFSAARPGQGGEGHINCQPKAYWSRLFALAGYYYHHEETWRFLKFMSQGPHMGWLLQNGMVFRRTA